MPDRKYRQRGYMDDGGDKSQRGQRDQERGPRPEPVPRELRKPNLPGFHDVIRCTRCGHVVTSTIALESRCARCGADLHACAQCNSFDTGSRFECMKPIAARVSPKDANNTCELFEPRVTVERETGSAAPSNARQAFDDLFK